MPHPRTWMSRLLVGGLVAASAVVAGSAGPASALTCAPDAYETDTAATAAPLTVGTALTRAICQAPKPFPRTEAGVDGDYFEMTARGGTAYTIELSNLGPKVNGNSMGVGIARLDANGNATSIPQNTARNGLRVITDVLPAGRYQVYVASGASQVYPETNTMDIATIEGADGVYSITARESAPAPVVTSVTLSPSTVNGGKSSTGTWRLSAPAPSGGMYLFTSSTDRFVANPATTFAPEGATSGTFAIPTKKISNTLSYTIGVAAGTGGERTAVLTVKK